jgi:hypothetical protein
LRAADEADGTAASQVGKVKEQSDGGGSNAAEHSSATFNANCAAAQDRSGSEFLAFRKYFERPDRIKVVENVSWFPLCELSVSAV